MLTCVKGINPKFKEAAEEAKINPRVREWFQQMTKSYDPAKLDSIKSARARPFVSPMTWAIFTAYSAIILQDILKMQAIIHGVGPLDVSDHEKIGKLLKSVLPYHGGFVDEFGDSGYYYLLEALEGRLVEEIHKTLEGVEADKAGLEQAAEIVRLSNELWGSAQLESMESGVPR